MAYLSLSPLIFLLSLDPVSLFLSLDSLSSLLLSLNIYIIFYIVLWPRAHVNDVMGFHSIFEDFLGEWSHLTLCFSASPGKLVFYSIF